MTISTCGPEESLRQQRIFASELTRVGLVAGDRVALAVPSCAELVNATLGALRIGVVPVPIDARLRDWERRHILSEAEPSMTIESAEHLQALLSGSDDPTIELSAMPRARPMHFTSGTTGRPKGVWSGLLSDAHAERLVMEERELWGFSSTDRHLVMSPLYHSAPLRFAIGTLLADGTITVMSSFDAAEFAVVVDQRRPTTAFCAPAHLQRIIEWIDSGHAAPNVQSFRLLAHAGAPCPAPLRRRVHELFGIESVWEFYGSTEGQFTTCPAPDSYRRPGSVGRVRPGRSMRADTDGQLWCTAPPWARFQYWRDDAKTAETWRDGPQGPEFTVGDLGRVEDDWVYLDSRRTDLIISGGVNVYPLEVEAALEDVAGLREIAVYGVPDERWGQRVVASYAGHATPEQLATVAHDRLSPPKRPKEYRRIDALPRTATGKVRRTDLAEEAADQ